MFPLNPKNISLTLFLSLALTLAVSSVEANDFAHPSRRDHDGLNRMIRKRSPQGQQGSDSLGLGVVNLGDDPNASSTSATTTSTTTGSASSQSATSTTDTSSTTSPSSSASLTASSTSPSSSSTSASSTTTTTTTSSSTTTTPLPTPTPAAQIDNTGVAQPATSTIFHTNSVAANDAAATDTPAPQSATSTKKSTITVILIVVAASVGGLAILWTIFRKWKLGHSSKFDERMAPIDWQPTNDEGIVPAHRAPSRASFTGSSAHGHAGGAYRDPTLEHDFTAPPSHLAPVGGYADLARGPSPQPQMQEALGRGPSMNRSYGTNLARGPSRGPGYDNGVPLHHQAAYGNADAYDYNGDAVQF